MFALFVQSTSFISKFWYKSCIINAWGLNTKISKLPKFCNLRMPRRNKTVPLLILLLLFILLHWQHSTDVSTNPMNVLLFWKFIRNMRNGIPCINPKQEQGEYLVLLLWQLVTSCVIQKIFNYDNYKFRLHCLCDSKIINHILRLK